MIAAVSPWNFPVDIAGIPIVYGLAARLHRRLEAVGVRAAVRRRCSPQLLADAGFPPGTVNVVHGRGETGAQVVRHPDVASIVFTGSVETGEKVARDAGLKNRVLELGGNGPQIVMADGDLEQGRRRRDHRLLLPGRPVLHGRRADPRPLVGQGPVRRRCWSSGREA